MHQSVFCNQTTKYISFHRVQGNSDGGGPNSSFPLSTSQENSSSIPSSPTVPTCPSLGDAGISTLARVAANERRNIYGLPHPQPTTTNQPSTSSTTTSSSSDDHVFAVPSPATSNRHLGSVVNGSSRHHRPHSYHQHNFNQTRVHHHHHDQAHHSANYYQQQQQTHSSSQHYHQSQHSFSNDFVHSQGEYNTYQKTSESNNQHTNQLGQRHRTLSEHR